MKDPVDRAVRAIARRQPFALLWAQFSVTHLVMLGGMGILRLYQPMSAAHFWVLVAISQVLIGIDNVIAAKLTYRLLRPVRAWLRGNRDERATIAAWRALVALPLDLLRRLRSLPLLFLYFPFIAFTTWLLELPWYSFVLLVLTVRALGSSLRDVQRATERVSDGDFTARVPVAATAETGRLAESFN